MSFKVLITDYYYPDLKQEKAVFEGSDIVIVDGNGKCSSEHDVITLAKDADAIMCQFVPITRKIIESLERCKVIVRYAIGVDSIDTTAATENGIMVANVPDYCLNEVADHAFALMLAVVRKIRVADAQVRAGNWDYKPTVPIKRLSELDLGLVSFGNIGRNFAEKASAFGFRSIRVYDPYFENARPYPNVSFVPLSTLLTESDIVSIHAPLTPETRHLINRDTLGMMKDGSFLINTSRGGLINESDLVWALESGKLAGVGLDVLEDEKNVKDHALAKFKNVIITPHMGWYSVDSISELQRKAAEQVKMTLLLGQPKYWVNPF